jgi:hypothetical protein
LRPRGYPKPRRFCVCQSDIRRTKMPDRLLPILIAVTVSIALTGCGLARPGNACHPRPRALWRRWWSRRQPERSQAAPAAGHAGR